MRKTTLKALCLCLLAFPLGQRVQAEPAADKEIRALKAKIEELTKAFEAERQRQEAQLNALREQINRLEQAGAAAPAPTPTPGLTTAQRLFQSFNPDISLIGDFLFTSVNGERGEAQEDGSNANEDRFQVRQVELAMSGSVDPYARGDVFLHVEEEDGEWHVGLCEAYLTLLALPADLQARLGKFRPHFGKASTLHTHAMPWPDYPDMVTNFFGEEGMSEEGVELSWLVPNPWDKYLELSYAVQNNENEASFAGNRADDVMHVAHLKSFFELPRDWTLELGGSAATGPNDDGHGGQRTNLFGSDLTFKWRSPTRGQYRSLTWQSEFLLSDKEQDDGSGVDSWGAYSALGYQFLRRWTVYGRYDYSELPDDSLANENSFSLGLTFAQSEYCFWRLGVKHSEYDGAGFEDELGEDRTVFFLQLDFGLGPHRAHQY